MLFLDHFPADLVANHVPCETEIHFSFRVRLEGTSARNLITRTRSISYRACANYVSIGTRAQHARAKCTRNCFCWFSEFEAVFERKILYWRLQVARFTRAYS